MRTAKRSILLILCAMLLVIASVFGTMAYLTDTDSVVNTFTVGDVKIFLDEAKVDEYGVAYTGEAAERVDANSYKLIPNQYYVKDPTVTVEEDSEESYIRMIVTVDKMDELDAIFDSGSMFSDFFKGNDPKEWAYEGYKADDTLKTRSYEFRYVGELSVDGVVDAREAAVTLPPLFDQIYVPANVTDDQLDSIANMQITVEANAIQAMGFDNAAEAWAAFTK